MRQLYMASKHIEWSPFARSMGWDANERPKAWKVDEWIAQKRTIIAREQAETISDMVFNHRSRWHSDVLSTLSSYPKAFDAVSGLINARINDIIGIVNRDEQLRAESLQTGIEFTPRFRNVKTSELVSLAAALKICTEGKHKSLLIGDWSFKTAETFSDPRQFQQAQERLQNREWTVEIIGAEGQSHRQIEKMLGEYYDQPPMPHTPDEVEAAATVVSAEAD